MRIAVWLLLAGGWFGSVRAESVSLQAVRWKIVADSLQVEFGFAQGRPARYRIRPSADSARDKSLVVEFGGARLPDAGHLKSPKWLRVLPSTDSGVLVMEIGLRETTPWKADWDGSSLRLNILNRVNDNPVWKNPWILGGLGSAILTGGVIFWLSGLEHSKSPATPDGMIPPPDVVFPQ